MPLKGPFTPDQLHVIAVISNPMRFASRYRLYNDFKLRMAAAGVTLWTVEVAFGDRPFEVTTADDPRAVQLRTFFELWHKENMCNLGIQRLPLDAEYIACVDADIAFTNPNWAVETIHQLQHHYVVQMFSEVVDLGPDGRQLPGGRHDGLVYRWLNGLKTRYLDRGYTGFGHPGFCWAYRREALDMVGGLLDTAILGSGDHHMALGYFGAAEQSMDPDVNQAYYDEVLRWQARAVRYLTRDVGYVPGTINHFFHGSKKNRFYLDRRRILIKHDYTPHLDLMRDCQGLYQLTDLKPELRDDIRRYFRSRNEDGTEA